MIAMGNISIESKQKRMSNPTSVEFSRSLNELGHGSMKPSERWILLEYTQAWGDKAFDSASIPEIAKTHFMNLDGRILLIRQPARAMAEDIRLFIAETPRNASPTIKAYTLNQYEDIADLDKLTPEIITDEHYFVCTNGRRDICCSTYGVPVFNALVEQVGDRVWQCSHIGGHRFAGTLISFASGITYGILDPSDVSSLIEEHESGNIMLDKYRANVAYSAIEQSAEYFLRQHTQNLKIDALTVHNTTQENEQTIVTMSLDDIPYRVIMRQGEPYEILATTGTDKYKMVTPTVLTAIEQG